MHLTTALILSLIYKYGYLILFPLVVVEGPFITVVSGYLISTGFMLFLPVYITVVVADLTGDILYYSAGRFLLHKKFYGILGFFGINPGVVRQNEKIFKRNRGKILFFGKLSHVIGAPILVAAGAVKVSLRDFLWFNFWATLPKSLIFLLLGYYFGHALRALKFYLGWTYLGLAIFTLVIILIYRLVYNKVRRQTNTV